MTDEVAQSEMTMSPREATFEYNSFNERKMFILCCFHLGLKQNERLLKEMKCMEKRAEKRARSGEVQGRIFFYFY